MRTYYAVIAGLIRVILGFGCFIWLWVIGEALLSTGRLPDGWWMMIIFGLPVVAIMWFATSTLFRIAREGSS